MAIIDINDLVDYLVCPLRLSFVPTNDKQFNTYFSLRSYIYGKLFNQCLYLNIVNQKITIAKLNNKLNYLWDEIKKDIATNLSVPELVSIKHKLKHIYNLFKDIKKVIYFDVPRTISILDTDVLYRFSSYYDGNGLFTSVIKFNNLHLNLTQDSYTVRLIYNLIRSDLKTIQDKYKHNIKLFRCDTAELYQPDVVTYSDWIIENVIRGIQEKVFYPRNDYLTCKTCVHKEACSWSLSE